jgi:hypothetical protein
MQRVDKVLALRTAYLMDYQAKCGAQDHRRPSHAPLEASAQNLCNSAYPAGATLVSAAMKT